jgi:hypothetical protein
MGPGVRRGDGMCKKKRCLFASATPLSARLRGNSGRKFFNMLVLTHRELGTVSYLRNVKPGTEKKVHKTD